jgi:hypothetical protein
VLWYRIICQKCTPVLQPCGWRRHVSPKRLLTFNGLHDVISHKTILYSHCCDNPKSVSTIGFNFCLLSMFVVRILVSWGVVRMSPLGTSVTNWPIVPAADDRCWWMWSSRWNENWQGNPNYSGKTCPCATLSTTNPTWPELGSNPGRRGRKPATNRLSMARPQLYL